MNALAVQSSIADRFRGFRRLLSFFLLLLPFLVSSQVTSITHYYYNDLDTIPIGGKWINDTRAEGSPHTWKYFSIIDKWKPYSVGLETEIPSDLRKKKFKIFVHGFIRISNPAAENILVTTITKGDSALFWNGKDIAKSYGKVGEWTAFADTITLSQNINPDGKIQIYVWNKDGKYETGIDDFEIYFTSIETPATPIVAHRFFNGLDGGSIGGKWTNKKKAKGVPHSWKYFSIMDKWKPYSLGLETKIPDDLARKNFMITVHGFIRISDPAAEDELIIAIDKGDSSVFWEAKNIAKLFGKSGEWTPFTDTVLVPQNIPPDSKVKIYVWNKDKKYETGIDDLDIYFTSVDLPSSIPSAADLFSSVSHTRPLSSSRNANKIITGKYSGVITEQDKNTISLTNGKGNLVIPCLGYLVQYISKNSIKDSIKDTVSVFTNHFDWVVTEDHNEETVINFEAKTDFSVADFTLKLSKNSSEIKVSSAIRYLRDVEVIREALVLPLEESVTEVYRKNGMIDKDHFQKEYWLGKEGVKAGSGDKTFLVYRPTEVSSLQLNVPEKQLFVNLDYFRDHPFDHFPSRDSAMNVKEDLSTSAFKAGESKGNSFSFNIGQDVPVVQLMQSPNGYLSSLIFTEHADWTDLSTHYAVYYGSDSIGTPDHAIGGFVKNKIPVTKSVFYSNPDNVLNSDKKGQLNFKSPITTIKGTDGYLNFLSDLQKKGSEICLHTPDQFTAKSPLIEEALVFMQKNFPSPTWIDHGYDNGPKNNRESFVCDGLTPLSPSYSKDLWEKYGIKYFWNSYYEDFTTPDSAFLDFNSSLLHPYTGFGDAAPTPLYWQHPTRTGKFYSWPTREVFGINDTSGWGFLFNDGRLNDFANQQGVKFLHCYPAACVSSTYWKFDSGHHVVIEPEFEKALGKIAAYRDKGLINLTTVSDLLNYWTACENIRFTYLETGQIIIENAGDSDIKGLSLTMPASVINGGRLSVNLKTPSEKVYNDRLIFWFDLKAKGSAVISFVK